MYLPPVKRFLCLITDQLKYKPVQLIWANASSNRGCKIFRQFFWWRSSAWVELSLEKFCQDCGNFFMNFSQQFRLLKKSDRLRQCIPTFMSTRSCFFKENFWKFSSSNTCLVVSTILFPISFCSFSSSSAYSDQIIGWMHLLQSLVTQACKRAHTLLKAKKRERNEGERERGKHLRQRRAL